MEDLEVFLFIRSVVHENELVIYEGKSASVISGYRARLEIQGSRVQIRLFAQVLREGL